MYQVYIYKPALCLLQKELYLPHSTDVRQLGPGGVYPNALEGGGRRGRGNFGIFFVKRGRLRRFFAPIFAENGALPEAFISPF